MSISDFTDLQSWQVAHTLVVDIYRMTQKFPAEERFGLTNQIRRAAVSITSNIAEGFARKSSKEKIQFYYMAQGSTTEVQSQLYIAKDVGYVDNIEEILELTKRVQMLINGMIRSLKNTLVA